MSNPYWDDVWERKGSLNNGDLRTSCGWEDTTCSAKDVYSTISDDLSFSIEDSILEVGCGSGHLATEFIGAGHNYSGIDNSKSLITMAIKSFPDNTFNISEACSLKFDNNSFDYAIVYSVFQYFPDYEYAERCINELARVSRKGIYIGDLVESSNRDTHLTFNREKFKKQWKISEGVYTPKRFNAFMRK